jgi:cyclophilin family peptidyl-prolyl cis-trans isomerase
MYYKHAPKTCRNFVELARRGYYNDTIFHRIIKVSPLLPLLFFCSRK